MNNTIRKSGTFFLGSMNIRTGIYVTDPCYKVGTCGTKRIMNMLPGKYAAFLTLSDEGAWGLRVASIFIKHEYYVEKLCEECISEGISVDSGQCGFFLKDKFEEQSVDDEKHKEFYISLCCNTAGKFPYGGIVGSYGIVSSSGYGDGEYPLFVARDDDENIVGVMLQFLEQ